MDTSADVTVHDLKVLSIGYYIQGGIVGCYSLVMLAYAGFIGAVFVSAGAEQRGHLGLPPILIPIVIAIVAIVILLGLTFALCLLISGHWLTRHRNTIFIQIVAAVNCLLIPYGTVLGIFTFLVLHRPVARQLFSAPPPEFATNSAGPA